MIKNTLNNKLFNDNKQLKPEVLEGLRKIVDRFITELKEEHIPLDVLDYWLVGSNASFNYKPTSDIDVHLIADLSKVSKDPGVLQILYNYFKSVFNSKYDITCKGLPVELYVEDVESSSVSNGVYSIMNNKWIKFPKEIDEPDIDIAESEEYRDLLKEYSHLSDDKCEEFINKLYMLRKESLINDGEYGKGNLIFKKFRDDGLLDILKERRDAYTSDDLTVESLREAINKFC